MRLALFRGAEGGDAEQGFTGKSFKQGLIFGSFHGINEVIRKLLKGGHELGYTAPGDPEAFSGSSICSLRVGFEVFTHFDGHSHDILMDWPWFLGYTGQWIV